MDDLKERFTETAVRPLADNAEMRLAAARLLSELTVSNDGNAAEAIQRWDAMDAKKRKPLGRIMLFSILAIVSAVILIDGGRRVFDKPSVFGLTSDMFYGYPKMTDEMVSRNLSAGQRLLLFGDASKSTKAEQMKALWDSAPTNPAYFADYARAYLSDYKKLPLDFLVTARGLDPQNAWFTYVAAGVKAKAAVKIRKRPKGAKAANEPPEWDVIDEAKFNESLALFREARNQSRCESYEAKLLRQRMHLLPGKQPAEVVHSIGYILGKPGDAEISLRELANAVAAKAWLVGEKNDSPGFRELLLIPITFSKTERRWRSNQF